MTPHGVFLIVKREGLNPDQRGAATASKPTKSAEQRGHKTMTALTSPAVSQDWTRSLRFCLRRVTVRNE